MTGSDVGISCSSVNASPEYEYFTEGDGVEAKLDGSTTSKAVDSVEYVSIPFNSDVNTVSFSVNVKTSINGDLIGRVNKKLGNSESGFAQSSFLSSVDK